MRNICLSHSHNHRELSKAKSNLMGKSDQMGESSNYESLNQRSLKFHYYSFLQHALLLSCYSFSRGQNFTGDLTTRGNTLYLFFCNKNIFVITTEINTLYSPKFELLLGISTITKSPKIVTKQKIPSFAIFPTLPFCNYSFSKCFKITPCS